MQSEQDGMQYNSFKSAQRKWESFKLSLVKTTEKDVPLLKNKLRGRNSKPPGEGKTAVIAEKSKDRSRSLQTRHWKTTEFLPD